jgi:hypothetical protein
MSQIVKALEEVNLNCIASFSTDEIVLDITDMIDNRLDILDKVETICNAQPFPTKIQLFVLNRGTVGNTSFYYKQKLNTDVAMSEDSHLNAIIELKCIDAYMLPFVMRYYNKEEVLPSDKVFENEYGMCAFLGDIEVSFDGGGI